MTLMTVTGQQPACTIVSLDDRARTVVPAAQLGADLCALLTEGTRTVVVDVTGLQTLSADVVSALLGARREATARGARIVLRAQDARSRGLLQRCALDGLFTVVRDAAPDSLWRHG